MLASDNLSRLLDERGHTRPALNDRMLGERLLIQDELISCLGLERAPNRYITTDWVESFGHIALIGLYEKLLRLDLVDPARPIIFFGDEQRLGNPALLKYWSRYFKVVIDPDLYRRQQLEAKILEINMQVFALKGKRSFLSCLSALYLTEHRWRAAGYPPLLQLDPADSERGWAILQSLGVPPGSWFVTLHIREEGFAGDPTCPRNSKIESYFPAIREIVAHGGWVVRLGDPRMSRLPAMPGVIDYPHTSFKSDWMDVFLIGAARFFIGVSSGPSFAPSIFGVPTVLTNWTPVATWPWVADSLLIHKLYRDRTTGRKLPYSQIASQYLCSAEKIARDISLEENTPEEIREVVVEMFDRLAGILPDDAEDCERHSRLIRILQIDRNDKGKSRLGRRFLSAHSALLE